ncbi:MAG: hypothetical protein HC772_04335 [Leptolyngbyaceae cyanobacterium CRU_2_3]|nr:hypothetical protein [Leptolyngbyaceae cyanobacterium CRU_2_3]
MAGEQGINLKLATPEQLNSYRSSSQMITHRSFPEDVSDELLDRYCRNYYDCYLEEVIPQTIRQQAKKDQKVSWLSLEELNSFDWFGYQGRGYGQVKPRHVALFGDGEQMWQDAMYDKVLRWVYYPLRGEAPIPNNNGCEAGYVQVSWIETQNQPYAETAGSIFMQHLLPLLRSYGSPKEVRIIFWLNA